MPRYFFDVLDDVVAIDEEGSELPDPDAAIARAREEVLILAGEQVTTSAKLVLQDCLRVRDEAGATLATICFGEVIEIIDRPRDPRRG